MIMEGENLFPYSHSKKHGVSINELWFKKAALEVTCAEPKEAGYPFITISRQAGAGGHSLATALLKEIERRVADPLFRDWQVFDNELCHLVMRDEHLKVTLDSLMTEKFRTEFEDFWAAFLGTESPQLTVAKKVCECIRTLAKVGKVIVVGRGGACLTRDLKTGVHVRLVAPFEARVKRIMELRQVREAEAKRLVEEWDHSRAKLIKTYFSRDIEDPLLYDVTWNTDQVPMEMIARAVVEMVCRKVLSCSGDERSSCLTV